MAMLRPLAVHFLIVWFILVKAASYLLQCHWRMSPTGVRAIMENI